MMMDEEYDYNDRAKDEIQITYFFERWFKLWNMRDELPLSMSKDLYGNMRCDLLDCKDSVERIYTYENES